MVSVSAWRLSRSDSSSSPAAGAAVAAAAGEAPAPRADVFVPLAASAQRTTEAMTSPNPGITAARSPHGDACAGSANIAPTAGAACRCGGCGGRRRHRTEDGDARLAARALVAQQSPDDHAQGRGHAKRDECDTDEGGIHG